MNGRDIAVCVLSGLTVASAAGVLSAAVMVAKRKGLPGDAVLVLGPSLALGLWAALGWAWWLVTEVSR